MLRVLDYSRVSRHLFVTAGDDRTVYPWDTTLQQSLTESHSISKSCITSNAAIADKFTNPAIHMKGGVRAFKF